MASLATSVSSRVQPVMARETVINLEGGVETAPGVEGRPKPDVIEDNKTYFLLPAIIDGVSDIWYNIWIEDSPVPELPEDHDDSFEMVIPPTWEERLTPPDGGFGWLVVAATFLISFLLGGFVESFNVFRVAIYREFPAGTPSEVSWITGLLSALSFVLSPVTSALIPSLGSRTLVLIGGLLCSTGLGISYFATSSAFLIGSLGVLMGVGSSLAITSSIVSVSRFFTKRRPLAMALALSGGCVGAVSLPVALEPVLHFLGLRYSFLVLAAVFLTICVCSLVFGPPEGRFVREVVQVPFVLEAKETCIVMEKEELSPREKMTESIVTRLSLRYLKDSKFLLTAATVFAVGIGGPHFVQYIPQQAKSLGIGDGPAMMLFLYVAAGDLLIRLSYGLLASRFTFPCTVEYTASLVISATSVVLIPFCTSYWHLIVISVMAGVGIGLWTTLIPLILIANHGENSLSGTFAWLRLFQGCAHLIYFPVADAVRFHWGVQSMLIFAGSKIYVAALLSLALLVLVKVRSRSS